MTLDEKFFIVKKRIGISFTYTRFQDYWNWFTEADLNDDVELTELSFERNNVDDIYSCDGFVLTGGVDVEPALYSGTSVYDNRPESFQRERDRFEEKIYRYAQAHGLPVLGICRGLQLVNVLEGGRLIQDLASENKTHWKGPYDKRDKQHNVRIEKDSLLYEIAAQEQGHVNSAHHQAVDKNILNDKLRANAFSDAGTIIEGLEFKDKQGKGFMLCVQWHPERMTDKEENPLSIKIKDRFIEEVKKARRSQNENH